MVEGSSLRLIKDWLFYYLTFFKFSKGETKLKLKIKKQIKKQRNANSDGLINCLPPPRQNRNQPPKSMRLNFNPLIKFCGTLTVSSPWTRSIGLRADALVPCFLLAIWTVSSWPKTHIRYPDLVPFRQLHHDKTTLIHLSGLAKNAAPRRWRHLIKPPGR
jgi:hypothetical protein